MTDKAPPRTVRLSDDNYAKLMAKYGSLTRAVESLLGITTPTEGAVSTPKRGGKTPTTWPYTSQVRRWEELLLPVGDLVATGYMATWPINQTHHKTLVKLFEPWTEAGFVLLWGNKETDACTCVNSRLQPYFAGDRKVWCDFAGDPKLGLEFLEAHPQVLVPMLCDLTKYLEDDQYKLLHDLYDRYYKVYFISGRPHSDD